MEMILFDRTKYEQLYSCPQLSDSEWQKLKHPNVVIGVIYMILATIYQLAYIPFLIVMLKKEFIQHSCYKLMFFLGVVDILATLDGGTIAGYYLIKGDTWCTNKSFFFYTVSALSGTTWVGACSTGFLLLINRILDLFYPSLANLLFGGYKTCLWLILPCGYMFYIVFFTQPFFPNSYLGAFFMDPYFGLLNNTYFNPKVYSDDWLDINNIGVIVIFPLLYILLCLVLFIKTKQASSATISKLQKQTIFQSLFICCLILATAFIYAYMQHFPTPAIVIVLGHMCWQASHGGAVMAYIFINKSMRRAVIKMIKNPLARHLSRPGQNLGQRQDGSRDTRTHPILRHNEELHV